MVSRYVSRWAIRCLKLVFLASTVGFLLVQMQLRLSGGGSAAAATDDVLPDKADPLHPPRRSPEQIPQQPIGANLPVQPQSPGANPNSAAKTGKASEPEPPAPQQQNKQQDQQQPLVTEKLVAGLPSIEDIRKLIDDCRISKIKPYGVN